MADLIRQLRNLSHPGVHLREVDEVPLRTASYRVAYALLDSARDWLWMKRLARIRDEDLEWREVNGDRTEVRLSPAKSKNDEGRRLPVTGELAEVIERAHAMRRLDCPFVFHNDGRPIRDFRGAWSKACTDAGLGNLLIHDLRRSAIRHMVRSGISEGVAMKLSGHKTRSVFEHYNIKNDADLIDAVERRDQYLSTRPTERKVIPLEDRDGMNRSIPVAN